VADDATWHILASTMLRAVSYESRSRQLRVRFATGAIYVYLDVPRGVVDALLDPTIGSPGRYFNEHIRDEFDCDEER
jgi:KTSC domain